MATIKVFRPAGADPVDIYVIPKETLKQKRARERNNVRTGNYEQNPVKFL